MQETVHITCFNNSFASKKDFLLNKQEIKPQVENRGPAKVNLKNNFSLYLFNVNLTSLGIALQICAHLQLDLPDSAW